jgi:hypothetical protein
MNTSPCGLTLTSNPNRYLPLHLNPARMTIRQPPEKGVGLHLFNVKIQARGIHPSGPLLELDFINFSARSRATLGRYDLHSIPLVQGRYFPPPSVVVAARQVPSVEVATLVDFCPVSNGYGGPMTSRSGLFCFGNVRFLSPRCPPCLFLGGRYTGG